MRTLSRYRAVLIAVLALFIGACSFSQTVDFITSPIDTSTRYVTNKAKRYLFNPTLVVKDIAALRNAFQRVAGALKGEAEEEWGKGNARLPGTKRYVKYTDGYQTRALVDFSKSTVTIETVATTDISAHLVDGLADTLMTPDDPRAVDLYTAEVPASSGQPYLYGLVVDDAGQPIVRRRQALVFAQGVVAQGITTRQGKGGKAIHSVRLPMVRQALQHQAQRYRPLVVNNSQRYGVDPSLIYAIIETESAFNPYAVSSAPAFGLMQLVPTTGGRDAYRFVERRDGVPSQDELFTPPRNIELGTAYLHILFNRYLKDVRDPLSREYCVISAYNGGAGNVLKTFHSDRKRAVAVINSLPPDEVRKRLQTRHPRAESRRYLVKVLAKKPKYTGVT
ncbi:MAG: murein transglycosylase domain-containing protein [Gammaproteobacteria bacterium]